MSGHKKDEDEQKQHSETAKIHVGQKEDESNKHREEYLDAQNIGVVDGQLTQLQKDHEAPQQ